MIAPDLARLAQLQPDAEFASFNASRATVADISRLADGVCRALTGGGVSPGDRVALLARNSIEYAAVLFGCLRSGAVLVTLNTRLTPAEWAYILGDSGARVVIASADFVDTLENLRNELRAAQRFVAIAPSVPAGWETLANFVASAPREVPMPRLTDGSDAVQLYTSGTTGHPKGAVLSQRAISALARAIGYVGVRPDDRVLVVVPMFHIFGVALTVTAVHLGCSLRICADFNPVETVRLLSEDRISVPAFVPAMIQACLSRVPDVATRPYPALRLVIYGASPISAQTLRMAAAAWRCDFAQAYGMTEIAPVTVLTAQDHRVALRDRPELLTSAGREMQEMEIRIVGPNDEPVPPGTVGEIVARGPLLMSGYWNQPQATAEAIRRGWMHTGDAGHLDADGYLFLKDRLKDMIVTCGENVYPLEIERTLCAMPGIADAAVIGVPHEKWGEAVLAFVVRQAGTTIATKDVIDFCRERLAGFKRPRTVAFLDALPRNAGGKVLRRQLREPYWRGHDRSIAGA